MMRTLTLCLVCLAFSACGGAPDSPEAGVRAWIERAEVAAEEKDRRTLMSMISEHYADARGNDHEQLGKMLRVYFFRQQTITLLTTIDEILISGSTAALAQVTVGMAGTGNSALGFRADAYRFELELEKPDEDWILIGARWGELGGEVH